MVADAVARHHLRIAIHGAQVIQFRHIVHQHLFIHLTAQQLVLSIDVAHTAGEERRRARSQQRQYSHKIVGQVHRFAHGIKRIQLICHPAAGNRRCKRRAGVDAIHKAAQHGNIHQEQQQQIHRLRIRRCPNHQQRLHKRPDQQQNDSRVPRYQCRLRFVFHGSLLHCPSVSIIFSRWSPSVHAIIASRSIRQPIRKLWRSSRLSPLRMTTVISSTVTAAKSSTLSMV